MKKWMIWWWTVCLLVGAVTLADENRRLKGDLNGDGIVNFSDLAILSQDWLAEGTSPQDPNSDFLEQVR